MAYEIADFDGAVIAPSGTNPYGLVKDDPAGTAANAKCINDIQVTVQRLMAKARVVPNSLPENVTNGFQIKTAIDILINNQALGLATAMADSQGITGLNAMRITGVVSSAGGFGTLVTAGWVWYNGQYCYATAANIAITAGVLLATIATVDGLPTITWSYASSVTDATHFPYTLMVDNALTVLQTDILTLSALIAALQPLPWTNISVFSAGWSAGTTPYVPRYTKDGNYKVWCQGDVIVTGATTNPLFTLPAGMRPSQNLHFTCPYYTGTGAVYDYCIINIVASSGDVQFVFASSLGATVLPSTATAYVDLTPIQFLTL